MAPPKSVAAQYAPADDPTLLPSDDEDDSDFHLSDAGGAGSDSGDDSEDDELDAQRANKRTKVDDPAPPALDKAAVDDLWAAFNDPTAQDPYAPFTSAQKASPLAASTSGAAISQSIKDSKGKSKAADDDMVEIEVEYGFAGEKIRQKKRVLRSSAEAQAYFATRPASSDRPAAVSTPVPSVAKDPTAASVDALFGPDKATPDANSAVSAPLPASTSTPPAPPSAAAAASRPITAAAMPRPGPKRKAGGGLAGMAASLGVGKKPAKLNTLEKSKLDWDSYVSTQDGLSDTLTHARKDGYLDRRDFLDRVEGAKERQWEEHKSRRR